MRTDCISVYRRVLEVTVVAQRRRRVRLAHGISYVRSPAGHAAAVDPTQRHRIAAPPDRLQVVHVEDRRVKRRQLSARRADFLKVQVSQISRADRVPAVTQYLQLRTLILGQPTRTELRQQVVLNNQVLQRTQRHQEATRKVNVVQHVSRQRQRLQCPQVVERRSRNRLDIHVR